MVDVTTHRSGFDHPSTRTRQIHVRFYFANSPCVTWYNMLARKSWTFVVEKAITVALSHSRQLSVCTSFLRSGRFAAYLHVFACR